MSYPMGKLCVVPWIQTLPNLPQKLCHLLDFIEQRPCVFLKGSEGLPQGPVMTGQAGLLRPSKAVD